MRGNTRRCQAENPLIALSSFLEPALSTVSLPFVRLQFHHDAAAWQAAGDEGAGLASLRHGQRELLLHRTHSRRQRCCSSELGSGRSSQTSRASLKAELVVVTIDEMWHFVKKRLTNSGFGGPMTLLLGEPLPGFLVAVMTPHAKNSSTKSASKARPSSPMTGKAITVSSPRANSSPAKT